MTAKEKKTKAPEPAAKQISLLPATPPKAVYRRIPLTEFKGMQMVGPEPSAATIRSVEAIGVFEPIIVFQPKEGRPKIGDGIRRLKASIVAEKKDIPAMVYEDEEQFRAALSLIANSQRSANPLAEVRAIMRLQKKGFSVEQIAESTGMPQPRIKSRLRLNALVKPLYDGMFAGKIAVTLGMAACKLPVAYQKQLVTIYRREGKVKMLDLKGVKDVRHSAALAVLPAEIFSPAPKAKKSGPAAEARVSLSDIERELLDAYRERRAVDGGKYPTQRTWSATQFSHWDDEVVRLEGILDSARIVDETAAAPAHK